MTLTLRKFRYLAAILAALIGLGAFAAAASAGITPVKSLNSQYLAGHIAASTLRIDQNRGVVSNLPDLNQYTVACVAAPVNPQGTTGSVSNCESTVAIGLLVAQNTNGGTAFATAFVWDAGNSTCPGNEFTLEGGTGFITPPPGGGITVLPASDLFPLRQFGADQCFAPGSTEYIAVVQSVRYHEVYFTNGDNQADATVSEVPFHNVWRSFFAAGQGVDVTTGKNASFLPSGTLAAFPDLGLSVRTFTEGEKRITWDSVPTYRVDATETGGVPSVANPLTITSLGFGGTKAGPSSTSEVVP